MDALSDAMLNCLFNAQKQLEEAGGSGISVMLMGTDKVIRHVSAVASLDDLLQGMFFCAWELLRKVNPDATPVAFAQAAYATALRTGIKEQQISVLSFLQDHVLD